MASVADELRRDALEEVQLLSPEERVELALELGDFDLALFCEKQRLKPTEAIERLRRSRQLGRRTFVRVETIP